MWMRTGLLCAICLYAAALRAPATAQELPLDLFRTIEVAPTGTELKPDTRQLFLSRVDIRGVAERPTMIRIRIPRPNGEVVETVRFESMDRREGFSERDGARCFLTGDPIACEIIPIPNLPEDQFSFTWTGQGNGYDLRITIHRGHVIGMFSGAAGRFDIALEQSKELRVEFFRINDGPPTEQRDISAYVTPPPIEPARVMSFQETQSLVVESITAKEQRINGAAPAHQIDMLVLFTEEARVAAMGNPAICSDTNGIVGLIIQGVRDVDTAFERSEIDASLGVVTIAKLNGFTLIPDDGFYSFVPQNRNNLNSSANIKAFRNAVGADVVQVIVDTQTNLGPCGYAYVQANNCTNQADPSLPSPCIGAALKEHALYLNTVQCSNPVNNFTHELGHVLGADHDFNFANVIGYQPYPYSFGYFVAGQFQTVMGQQGFVTPDIPRILQFSNPNVSFSGIPTGDAANADNARTISNLIAGVEAFRTRPEIIFANGFDGIAACPALNF